jgi:hypothetical protein
MKSHVMRSHAVQKSRVMRSHAVQKSHVQTPVPQRFIHRTTLAQGLQVQHKLKK